MILLKDLLTENREGGVYLKHKGEEIWFPAHTRRTISQLMPGDRVALYPKLMNSSRYGILIRFKYHRKTKSQFISC